VIFICTNCEVSNTNIISIPQEKLATSNHRTYLSHQRHNTTSTMLLNYMIYSSLPLLVLYIVERKIAATDYLADENDWLLLKVRSN